MATPTELLNANWPVPSKPDWADSLDVQRTADFRLTTSGSNTLFTALITLRVIAATETPKTQDEITEWVEEELPVPDGYRRSKFNAKLSEGGIRTGECWVSFIDRSTTKSPL